MPGLWLPAPNHEYRQSIRFAAERRHIFFGEKLGATIGKALTGSRDRDAIVAPIASCLPLMADLGEASVGGITLTDLANRAILHLDEAIHRE